MHSNQKIFCYKTECIFLDSSRSWKISHYKSNLFNYVDGRDISVKSPTGNHVVLLESNYWNIIQLNIRLLPIWVLLRLLIRLTFALFIQSKLASLFIKFNINENFNLFTCLSRNYPLIFNSWFLPSTLTLIQVISTQKLL